VQRAHARRRKQLHGRAKACGPDPPTLGSTPGSSDVGLAAETPRARGGRWLQSPVHRGERAISRKHRAGNAGCSGLACGHCRLLTLLQAGHGCGLHPAFPAPSVLKRVTKDASPGQCHAAEMRTRALPLSDIRIGRREASSARAE
jgi:hypothetical protein